MTSVGAGVVIDDPERMHLLGLLMQGLLAESLAAPGRARIAAHLSGDLRAQAGRMVATLRFDRGRVTILAGKRPRPKAWVKGTMAGMLDLITVTDPVRPLATRAVTFGGNLFWLLAALPLLVPEQAVRDRLRSLIPRALLPAR
jgi:hypothetical protein